MKKKLGVFLILGALCASLLAGCSTGAPANNNASSDTGSVVESTVESNTESAVDSSADEESSSAEEQGVQKADVKTEKYYENKTGDSSALLLKITGDSNPAINAINAEIADIQADYEEDLKELDDYSWVEYTATPSSNARFINIVVHNIEYPTYGYQGEIETFTYDIENKKQISSDEALNKAGLSVLGVEQLFVDYYNDLEPNNQYRVIDDFEVQGCVLYEDESAAVFLQVGTEDGPNMPMEYITGSSNELYVYHSAENSFSVFNFTNF